MRTTGGTGRTITAAQIRRLKSVRWAGKETFYGMISDIQSKQIQNTDDCLIRDGWLWKDADNVLYMSGKADSLVEALRYKSAVK